jgi:hypothetical protein
MDSPGAGKPVYLKSCGKRLLSLSGHPKPPLAGFQVTTEVLSALSLMAAPRAPAARSLKRLRTRCLMVSITAVFITSDPGSRAKISEPRQAVLEIVLIAWRSASAF